MSTLLLKLRYYLPLAGRPIYDLHKITDPKTPLQTVLKEGFKIGIGYVPRPYVYPGHALAGQLFRGSLFTSILFLDPTLFLPDVVMMVGLMTIKYIPYVILYYWVNAAIDIYYWDIEISRQGVKLIERDKDH